MVGKDESDPRVLLSDGRKVCEHCRHLGATAIKGLPETPVFQESLPCIRDAGSKLFTWLPSPWPGSSSGPKDLFSRELLLLESWSHLFTSREIVSVCYTPTLPFLKLLAAPKAVSHVPYNCIGAANSITAWFPHACWRTHFRLREKSLLQ